MVTLPFSWHAGYKISLATVILVGRIIEHGKILSRLISQACDGVHHFCSHSISDNSVTWQYLTAKRAKECNVAGQPFTKHFNYNEKKEEWILTGSNIAEITTGLSPTAAYFHGIVTDLYTTQEDANPPSHVDTQESCGQSKQIK